MEDLSTFTDRQWSIHATNRADQACALADDLRSRWNTMVQDNRFLLSQIDQMTAQIADLKETVDLLTGVVLRDA